MGLRAQGFRFRVGWTGLLARVLSREVLPWVNRKQEDVLFYRDDIRHSPLNPKRPA